MAPAVLPLALPVRRGPSLTLAKPIRFGAIDCGSNGIRAAVADLHGGTVRILEKWRAPVRLGADVFRAGKVRSLTLDDMVDAFGDFAAAFERYGVDSHRAVATSALRNAKNGRAVTKAIRRATGIELEAIAGDEEADLVRAAVLRSVPRPRRPRVIADLGGGSLELQVLRGERRTRGAVLPLGTVRLGALDVIDDAQADGIRRRVWSELDERVGLAQASSAILCGGNAKALARLFPGPLDLGVRTIDREALTEGLPRMCQTPARKRARQLDLRPDRADVIAAAGVIFDAVATWLGADRLLVPGVGVLDGLLVDQAEAGS